MRNICKYMHNCTGIPCLTSHLHRLVNEEDDSDESYEPRPEWAKAVPQQMARDSADEGQFDTLTALQEDALTIYREDLDDLEKIGEG